MFKKVVTVLSNPQALRSKSSNFPEDLSSFSEQDNEDLRDLIDTFNVLEGHGLALPQIGVKKRAVVVNFQSLGIQELSDSEIMINPSITPAGPVQKSAEACFSVPHVSALVPRPSSCLVSYTSAEGEKKELQLEGYAAACVQHEVDHLDGVLYVDHLSNVNRSRLLKKARKTENKLEEEKRSARMEFEREHSELYGVQSKKPVRRPKTKAELKKAKRKRKLQKASRRK